MCVCCGDIVHPSSIALVPCNHEYCESCTQRVVINSLIDEAFYPPRCCKQPFTIDSIRRLLTPELISGFHEKKIEFGTAVRIARFRSVRPSSIHATSMEWRQWKMPEMLHGHLHNLQRGQPCRRLSTRHEYPASFAASN